MVTIKPTPGGRPEPHPVPVQKLSYRLAEVVELTGLSLSLLYILMNDGSLPYTQIRGIRVITDEALRDFLNRYSQKGA